jgi:hypothetical protein
VGPRGAGAARPAMSPTWDGGQDSELAIDRSFQGKLLCLD